MERFTNIDKSVDFTLRDFFNSVDDFKYFLDKAKYNCKFIQLAIIAKNKTKLLKHFNYLKKDMKNINDLFGDLERFLTMEKFAG